jgi:hypothetical protein
MEIDPISAKACWRSLYWAFGFYLSWKTIFICFNAQTGYRTPG